MSLPVIVILWYIHFFFQIYYHSGSDTNRKFIDTPDNSTSFTITGLMPATNYTLYLSAFTGAGEGNFSVNITDMTTFDGKFLQTGYVVHCIS